MELVFGAYSGSGASGTLYAYNHDGTQASGFPKSALRYRAAIADISDLDKDNLVEIVMPSMTWSTNDVQSVEKYDLSGALESIEKQHKQDREDCFAKYPQL